MCGEETTLGSESTESLLRRIQERDEQAFEELVRRYWRAVYAIALRITKNAQDAEDVAQTAFLKIWRKASTWRGTGATSWILTIVRNLAIEFIRARERKGVTVSLNESSHPTPDNNPTVNEENSLLGKIIEECFTELGDDRRLAELRWVFDLKNAEITTVLGLSKKEVENGIKRARRKLRDCISGKRNHLTNFERGATEHD